LKKNKQDIYYIGIVVVINVIKWLLYWWWILTNIGNDIVCSWIYYIDILKIDIIYMFFNLVFSIIFCNFRFSMIS